MSTPLPYVFVWGAPKYADRRGQRCAVTARGRMNSIRIEFADGWRIITSRNAVRRFKEQEK